MTTTTSGNTADLQKRLRCGANASGLLLLLFYALVYGSTYLAAALMKQHVDISGGFFGDLYRLIAYILQYPVTVPILLWIFQLVCGRKTGQRLRDSFGKPAVPMKTMLRWVIICLGITYASTIISRMLWMLVQSLLGLELVAQSFAADTTWLSMLTNLTAMIVFAPVFEELLFRGTILRSMAHGGELPAAILCGIVFGLWHTNFDQTIYTAVMGFCAAMLYFKTRTLLAPMFMHAFMNTIGGIQSLFIGDFDPYEMMQLETDAEALSYLAENAGNLAVLLLSSMLTMGLMGLGIILLIIELVQHNELFRFTKPEGAPSAKQTLKICLTSPLLLLACTALLVMTVLRAMGIL